MGRSGRPGVSIAVRTRIVELGTAGHTSGQIASSVGVAPSTVRRYLALAGVPKVSHRVVAARAVAAAKAEVAEVIGEPLEPFVRRARAAGLGWRQIAADIWERSGGVPSPSFTTLARWFPEVDVDSPEAQVSR